MKIDPYWEAQIKNLRNDLAAKNFNNNFLEWEVIRSNMVVQWDDISNKESVDLYAKGFGKGIATPNIGHPNLVINVNANTIHILHHWMEYGSLKGINSILEIGGGFGEMCRLARALGFEGQYTIYDFPEMNVLQNLYLEQTCGMDGIKCISKPDFPKVDLLVSMNALSEMSLETRDEILKSAKFDKAFFCYYDCLGYNNKEWFRDMASRYPDLDFTFRDHPYRQLEYCIGRKNAGIPLQGPERPRTNRDSFHGGRS
jgi:hypothetical protein